MSCQGLCINPLGPSECYQPRIARLTATTRCIQEVAGSVLAALTQTHTSVKYGLHTSAQSTQKSTPNDQYQVAADANDPLVWTASTLLFPLHHPMTLSNVVCLLRCSRDFESAVQSRSEANMKATQS
eukprot:scaffold1204_cov407-Prasinococcus_capsulatus_cf.AAC.3